MHRFKSGRRLQPSVHRQGSVLNIPLPVRIALTAAAIAMMVSGYIWGDPVVIWQKAASICLECIGVG
jgi:hypothetical protein